MLLDRESREWGRRCPLPVVPCRVEKARGHDSHADVAMAKASAHDACLWVPRQGPQILGAISNGEAHPVHVFYKRIQATGLDFADASFYVETVVQTLGLAKESEC